MRKTFQLQVEGKHPDRHLEATKHEIRKYIKRELGDAVTFTQPNGGLFFWARLTGANGKLADANELAKRAIEKLVAFVPGAPFFAEKPDVATLRLSFATADVAKIEEGVKRLGQAL